MTRMSLAMTTIWLICVAPSLAAPPGELARFAHKGTIHALTLAKDGQHLLTASADKWAYALDAETLAPVRKFGPHNSEVTGVAGLKDKTVIVSTLMDPKDKHGLLLWDWENQRLKGVIEDTEMTLIGVTVAPNEGLLAVSLGSEDARLYSLPAGGRMGIEMRDPKRLCKAMKFSPDGRTMVMGYGGGVSCWEIADRVQPVGEGTSDTDGTINGIAWLGDSEHFFTAHTDGILRLWQRKDLTVIGRLARHAGETLCVAISPDGKLLAAGTSEGGLQIYTVGTQKFLKQVPHEKAITAVEFVTSDIVATGTVDGIVRLITLSSDTKAKPAAPKPPMAPRETSALAKVPPAEEVQGAIALIKDVFKKDYDAAKRPGERIKLAEKLLAQEANAESVERYALLEESLRLSIEAGYVKTALAAAERMTATFQQPPQFHLDFLTKLIDAAAAKDQGELASQALELAEFAAAAEQFDDAEQLGRQALKAATKGRLAPMQKSVREFAGRFNQQRERYDAYKAALPVLEKDPADTGANLAAGRYLCFSRGDWGAGIPFLALSHDTALRALAEQELKLTEDAAASRLALAEAWLAAADSAASADRPHFLASALYWYQQALPQLSSLQKLKAEQGIKKIGAVGVERK